MPKTLPRPWFPALLILFHSAIPASAQRPDGALPPPAPNAIAEPSFESGSVGWHGRNIRRVTDAEFVRTGLYGLLVGTDSTKVQDGVHYGSTGKWKVDGKTLRPEKGARYVASISVKGVRNYEGTTLHLHLCAENRIPLGHRAFVLTGEWQRVVAPFWTRDDTESIGISVIKDGGEGSDQATAFAVDDLVLRRSAGGRALEAESDLTSAEREALEALAEKEAAALAQRSADERRGDRLQTGAAMVGGTVLLVMAAFAAQWVLLLLLVLREFLGLLPQLTVAGVTVGVDGVATYAATAGFLFSLLFRRSYAPLRRPLVWIALAFVAVCALSLFHSSDPLFGFRQCFRFFTYIVFFWIAYTAADSAYVKRIVAAGLIVAATLLVLGAIQSALHFSENPLREYVRSMADSSLQWRVSGFKDYPHQYANMFLVLLPVVFWAARASRSKRVSVLLYTLLGACVLAIVATGVRSAMLAFVVECVVFLGALRRFRLLAAALLLFTAAGLGTGVFQARLDVFLNPERSHEWTSLDERRMQWAILDEAIRKHPIRGHGVGSVEEFLMDSPKSRGRWKSAHMDYRKFLFEAGLPGLVLYVLTMLALIHAGWRRRGSETLGQHLAAGVAAVGCAWLTIAAFDEVYQDWYPLTFWWVMAGVALGLPRDGSSVSDGAEAGHVAP